MFTEGEEQAELGLQGIESRPAQGGCMVTHTCGVSNNNDSSSNQQQQQQQQQQQLQQQQLEQQQQRGRRRHKTTYGTLASSTIYYHARLGQVWQLIRKACGVSGGGNGGCGETGRPGLYRRPGTSSAADVISGFSRSPPASA